DRWRAIARAGWKQRRALRLRSSGPPRGPRPCFARLRVVLGETTRYSSSYGIAGNARTSTGEPDRLRHRPGVDARARAVTGTRPNGTTREGANGLGGR